ncbi:hypothetical protein ITI46_25155 [Streptomyces oryzae]|uniref:Helix-turn-helix domain-containing protein n=1 Tax=Streptomyces oryzae TaxID=1434886 RepID=A0ABS3XHV6_9ACTN|nr:hypothetical protein [Streptomyces oryzae]MBO8194920.1 hypothetical protein [Streptomyces oryzae]
MASASPASRQASAATPHGAAVAGGVPVRRGPVDADAFVRRCAVVFRDEQLSLGAKGLFGVVSTYDAGCGVTAELIAERCPDSVRAVSDALGELERFGYLVREQPGGAGGTPGRGRYFVAEAEAGAAGSAAGAAEGGGPSAGSGARGREEGRAKGGGAGTAERRNPAGGEPFLVSGQVHEVLLAFPDSLREALRAAARTDRPRALVAAVERELRTVHGYRLAERVRRRWIAHGYARLLAEGALKSPVGAAVAMVKAGPCPDPRCEDGRLEDGAACRACEERGKDRRAERARRQRPPQEAAVPPSCAYCGTGLNADGACEECTRKAAAVREETVRLIDAAVQDWAAVPGTSAAGVRAEVETAVARARTDAAEAGASPAGQALAGRLAALEEARHAKTARRENGAGIRAGLPANADRRGHRPAFGTRP